MKKLLYILMAILPIGILSACSDDNDLPKVELTVTLENGTLSDGAIYVVKGEPVTISSITVKNLESNKGAMITSAAYYFDGYYIGTAVESPFRFELMTTEETTLGKHILEIVSPLFAVDKELATAVIVYPVVVVDNARDLPDAGQTTLQITPSLKN